MSDDEDMDDRDDGVDLARKPWTVEVPDCALSLLPRSSPSFAAFATGTPAWARPHASTLACRGAHGVWQEDQLIQQLVSVHGRRKWAVIASQLPGRSGKQCRERFKVVCVDVVPRQLGEIVLDVLERQGLADWRADPDVKAQLAALTSLDLSKHVLETSRVFGGSDDRRRQWETEKRESVVY